MAFVGFWFSLWHTVQIALFSTTSTAASGLVWLTRLMETLPEAALKGPEVEAADLALALGVSVQLLVGVWVKTELAVGLGVKAEREPIGLGVKLILLVV